MCQTYRKYLGNIKNNKVLVAEVFHDHFPQPCRISRPAFPPPPFEYIARITESCIICNNQLHNSDHMNSFHYSRRALTLLILSMLFQPVFAQTYKITGEENYMKPKYLLIDQSGEDIVDATSHFIRSFQRAGFQVIGNLNWPQFQIKAEQNTLYIAQTIQGVNEDVEESELKRILKKNNIFWNSGGKTAVEKLMSSGHVSKREDVVEVGKLGRKKTITYYSWTDNYPLPELSLALEGTFHKLDFYYTYRQSLSCGTTVSEIHGSIKEVSGDRNEQLVSFRFTQPSLSSNCVSKIVRNLVSGMTRDLIKNSASERAIELSEVDFQKKGDDSELSSISSILIMTKPGADCFGIEGQDLEDDFALGLLSEYDVIDRSMIQAILAEQKLSMNGLLRDSDLITAGELAGAEALLTIQPLCLNGKSVLKVKMISVKSSLVLWSAIAKNGSASPSPEEVLAKVFE